MPSTGTTVLGTSALVAIVLAAGVGTSALDVTDQLEEALNATVDSAMRDMAVGWVEVTDAQGRVANGTIVEAELLVRPDGTADSLPLDRIVVERDRAGPVNLTVVDVLRDRDGSLDEDVINEDDLVRISLPLDPPLEAKQTARFSMHDPTLAPLDLHLTAPGSLAGTYAELDTRIDW